MGGREKVADVTSARNVTSVTGRASLQGGRLSRASLPVCLLGFLLATPAHPIANHCPYGLHRLQIYRYIFIHVVGYIGYGPSKPLP